MIRYSISILIVSIVLYYNFKHKDFDNKVLKLGTSVPISGIMKAWGEAVTSGANAYFFHANENNLLKDKNLDIEKNL